MCSCSHCIHMDSVYTYMPFPPRRSLKLISRNSYYHIKSRTSARHFFLLCHIFMMAQENFIEGEPAIVSFVFCLILWSQQKCICGVFLKEENICHCFFQSNYRNSSSRNGLTLNKCPSTNAIASKYDKPSAYVSHCLPLPYDLPF